MFRAGLLVRALPAIFAELVGLIWCSYRTGDRATALAAVAWLTSLAAAGGFAAAGLAGAVSGQPVPLRGPVIVAAVPASMWLARELIATLARLAARLLGYDTAEVDSYR